jgi:hypothetical protein
MTCPGSRSRSANVRSSLTLTICDAFVPYLCVHTWPWVWCVVPDCRGGCTSGSSCSGNTSTTQGAGMQASYELALQIPLHLIRCTVEPRKAAQRSRFGQQGGRTWQPVSTYRSGYLPRSTSTSCGSVSTVPMFEQTKSSSRGRLYSCLSSHGSGGALAVNICAPSTPLKTTLSWQGHQTCWTCWHQSWIPTACGQCSCEVCPSAPSPIGRR